MQIIAASHLDHGLTEAQVAHIGQRFAERDSFFIETFELPEELGTVPCGIHGPIMGDAPVDEAEVTYQVRGERLFSSRMIAKEERKVRTVTVIAGPHEDQACVLFTAFGGPLAPREPEDVSIPSDEERAKSRAFWAQHALSL
jgi:hypothetical protein